MLLYVYKVIYSINQDVICLSSLTKRILMNIHDEQHSYFSTQSSSIVTNRPHDHDVNTLIPCLFAALPSI